MLLVRAAGETHANTLGTNPHSATASAGFFFLGHLEDSWKMMVFCDLPKRTRRTLLENFKNKKKPHPETLRIGGQMCVDEILDYLGVHVFFFNFLRIIMDDPRKFLPWQVLPWRQELNPLAMCGRSSRLEPIGSP